MTVRRKLVLLLVGTAVVGGLLVGAAMFALVRGAVRERYVERLRSEADLLSGWVAAQTGAEDPGRWAAEWGARLDLRVTLIDAGGRVLGDSAATGERLAQFGNHLDRPEIGAAARTGWGSAYRASESTGERYFYLAHRVDGPGPVTFVRVALPAWQVRRAESQGWRPIALLLAVAPLTLAVATYFAVRHWSRPLERLAFVAQRIAEGEAAPAPTERDDEVGDLGRALERMRAAMAAKVEQVEAERRRLLTVIAGMRDGVLVLDAGLRVRLVNDAFRQAWSLRGEHEGKPVTEVVRHPDVLAAIEGALSGDRESDGRVADFTLGGKAYELHAAPLHLAEAGPAAGVVALFHDVSRLEKLEAVRREFVANVSHELRTPLTAIKGAALTLIENGDDAQARGRFLETIRRNAERMTALVEDLTDLSLIETGAIRLEPRPVELAGIVRDALAQVALRYARLGLAVTTDVPGDLAVTADRRRLEQILVNLLDNAMKFNRPGGAVTVSGRRSGDRIVLTVADTGIGIPADQIDKVFHRFHRVDPAGSQALGGTGLGLAIVKHLVQLHGGSVRVESELGQGSRFIVEL